MEHGFHQVVFRMSRIDHIGIATNDISKASEFWLMIGLQQGEDHVNLEQDVKIRMFHGNGENGSKTHSKVELIEALSEKSTIARFIARRGEGIQQLAISVNDIEHMVTESQPYKSFTKLRYAYNITLHFLTSKNQAG